MIEYRKIDPSERAELEQLISTVIAGLERKEFFIPFSDNEINAMFDESITFAYGAYDNGKLVGTAQLYFGDDLLEEIKQSIGVADTQAAELGGALVLPEYRGQGIMKHLAEILKSEAKAKGYQYIVAIAHPDNTASNNGIKAIGAHPVKTGHIGNYLRNMYLLSL